MNDKIKILFLLITGCYSSIHATPSRNVPQEELGNEEPVWNWGSPTIDGKNWDVKLPDPSFDILGLASEQRVEGTLPAIPSEYFLEPQEDIGGFIRDYQEEKPGFEDRRNPVVQLDGGIDSDAELSDADVNKDLALHEKVSLAHKKDQNLRNQAIQAEIKKVFKKLREENAELEEYLEQKKALYVKAKEAGIPRATVYNWFANENFPTKPDPSVSGTRQKVQDDMRAVLKRLEKKNADAKEYALERKKLIEKYTILSPEEKVCLKKISRWLNEVGFSFHSIHKYIKSDIQASLKELGEKNAKLEAYLQKRKEFLTQAEGMGVSEEVMVKLLQAENFPSNKNKTLPTRRPSEVQNSTTPNKKVLNLKSKDLFFEDSEPIQNFIEEKPNFEEKKFLVEQEDELAQKNAAQEEKVEIQVLSEHKIPHKTLTKNDFSKKLKDSEPFLHYAKNRKQKDAC